MSSERRDGSDPRFLELLEPTLSSVVWPQSPYVCLVVISDGELAKRLKADLSRQLVDTRCRWVSFVGEGADDWEDTVDWLNVEATMDISAADDFTICTTADESASLVDVANMIAFLSGPEYDRRIVLGIGPSIAAFEEIREAFRVAREGAV